MEAFAKKRGAKVLLCGHSLGGGAVEAAMARRPGIDWAFVYGSCGAPKLPFSGKDPRIVSHENSYDLVPALGKLGHLGFQGTKAATRISTTKRTATSRNGSAFSRLVSSCADFIRDGQAFGGGGALKGMLGFKGHSSIEYSIAGLGITSDLLEIEAARNRLSPNPGRC